MADIDEMVEELKQKRDELRLQIHLGSKEVQEEWEELEEKMEDFSGKAKEFSREAKFRETGEGVGRAVKELGSELKLGYKRIRDALKD